MTRARAVAVRNTRSAVEGVLNPKMLAELRPTLEELRSRVEEMRVYL